MDSDRALLRSRRARLAGAAGLLLAFLLPAVARADVSAMGRVVPSSGVIDLFGTSGVRIDRVAVKNGDHVSAGTVLAELATAAEARQRVQTCERRLADLRRQAEADAQLAAQQLKQAEIDAEIARGRYERIQRTQDSDFVSPDTVEERRSLQHSTAIALAAARNDQAKRREDLAFAVANAELDLRAARSALGRAILTAPLDATVLKVRARPGHVAGGSELFKLGDTSSMVVVAEVYETDALKVQVGDRAEITSGALAQPVGGVVEDIARLVYKDSLDALDPMRQINARVVEVRIRLDQVEPLDRLVFLQVEVKIIN